MTLKSYIRVMVVAMSRSTLHFSAKTSPCVSVANHLKECLQKHKWSRTYAKFFSKTTRKTHSPSHSWPASMISREATPISRWWLQTRYSRWNCFTATTSSPRASPSFSWIPNPCSCPTMDSRKEENYGRKRSKPYSKSMTYRSTKTHPRKKWSKYSNNSRSALIRLRKNQQTRKISFLSASSILGTTWELLINHIRQFALIKNGNPLAELQIRAGTSKCMRLLHKVNLLVSLSTASTFRLTPRWIVCACLIGILQRLIGSNQNTLKQSPNSMSIYSRAVLVSRELL